RNRTTKGGRMIDIGTRTVKNKYPIPLIADLFDQLGNTRWLLFKTTLVVQLIV
ncbi:hypothetical protein CCACVL1_20282, partial [Corchorus capsularis]